MQCNAISLEAHPGLFRFSSAVRIIAQLRNAVRTYVSLIMQVQSLKDDQSLQVLGSLYPASHHSRAFY